MYKIKWDKKSNGILLTNDISEDDGLFSPRPVFFEELDLLGLDAFFKYPKSSSPILWSIGRRYYYRGEKVAEARGGNMIESPEMSIMDNSKTNFNPINIDNIIKKNRQAIFTLENEAIDFIEYSYKKKANKSDKIAVAFSGGKDSQAILDLVSRVIPPTEYLVSFTDTDMEIPFTYDTVESTKKKYNKLYPGLQFYTASTPDTSISFWKQFGPPSRLIRWCCSVCKTAPFARLLNDLNGRNEQIKILVFEGVRADESPKRSRYERNVNRAKHINISNSRPILYWNTTEVFLYLFYRKILLNMGYRYGLTRIGCSICPFASPWSEFIISKKFPNLTKEYRSVLEGYSKSMGLKSDEKIQNYIKEGKWKTRAGGQGIDTNGTRIDIIQKSNKLNAIISNPRQDWFEWIKTLGDVLYTHNNEITKGEIKIENNSIPFQFKNNGGSITITIDNVLDKPTIRRKIKSTLYKATYCIRCGTCEAECPTGALQVLPIIKINSKKCIHCHNCLTFKGRGCLMAISVKESVSGGKMKNRSGIDRYSTFGMREIWVRSYLGLTDKWWESDQMLLGVKQIPAFVHWLVDSEMIDKNRKPTITSNKLKETYYGDQKLFWEILWVNLSRNSQVVKWYNNTIKWDISYTKEQLVNQMMDDFPDLSEGTLYNSITALINTFDSTPLGSDIGLGIIEKKGRAIKSIRKKGPEEKINPITVAYSLYRYSEIKNNLYLTVSELYENSCEEGPYKLFGISRDTIERKLKWLQENNKCINVELSAGLDNISLRDDLQSIDIIDSN